MTLLIQYTLLFASVLMLAALGGCFSERSGIVNIALEGIMVTGALGGALVLKFLPLSVGSFVMVVTAAVASAVLGLLCSLFLGVAAIHFKADQTITGTAINMLATAAATVGVKAMNAATSGGKDTTSDIAYPRSKDLLVLDIGGFGLNWFMVIAIIALIFAYVVLFKTSFGLRLRACGEHPQAADSVGISVSKMRYSGVLLSGVLGGLGGIAYITAGVSLWKFENGIAGFGFLAIAVMIFGSWHPLKIALASLLFGFLRALGNVYSGFSFLVDLNLPGVLYNMLPYVISLVVLMASSKNAQAPKAAGIPYDKGQR